MSDKHRFVAGLGSVDFSLWIVAAKSQTEVYATLNPLQNSRQQAPGPDERHRRVDAHGQEHDTESQTRIAGNLLGPLADRNPPINQKQPDAIGQMPYGRGNSNHINNKDRNSPELAGHNIERLFRMMSD